MGVIVPRTALPSAIPSTSQRTGVPLATQKLAMKLCVWPRATLAAEGEIAFEAAHVIVTVAEAVFELSAVLAAVTVTIAGTGGIASAV